jgi:hypothetical protein
MTEPTAELWRGEHRHPEELVLNTCDALLLNIGLLTLAPRPGPQQVSLPLDAARAQVREIAVHILDDLVDYGWTIQADEVTTLRSATYEVT